MFNMFEDDPFFNGLQPPRVPSILPYDQRRRGGSDRKENDREMDRFRDPFQSMMENMNAMIGGFQSHMADAQNNPDSHCYTSSMVMSYQNDGKSKPKFMQASSSTRRAPGDIKETRRTYRDSESGIEKMAIGHHIGRRGHEIEKRRQRGGAIEEEKRFYELDERDVPGFEQEWKQSTNSYTLPSQRPNRIREPRKRDGRANRHVEIEDRPLGPSNSGRLRR